MARQRRKDKIAVAGDALRVHSRDRGASRRSIGNAKNLADAKNFTNVKRLVRMVDGADDRSAVLRMLVMTADRPGDRSTGLKMLVMIADRANGRGIVLKTLVTAIAIRLVIVRRQDLVRRQG